MKKYRIPLGVVILLAILSLACNLTAANKPAVDLPLPWINTPTTDANQEGGGQIQSAGSLAACLTGTWQMGDLQNFLLAAVPADLLKDYQLTPKGSSGQLLYQFQSDGSVSLTSMDYQINLDAKYSILTVPLVVSLAGGSNAMYQIDGNRIGFFNPDTSSLSARVTLAGKDLVPQDQLNTLTSYAWFGANGQTTSYLTAQCSGDVLTLSPDPTSGLPNVSIALTRINP